ncbi:MAG: metallophosphoesterase [Bacteroidia bacterium]
MIHNILHISDLHFTAEDESYLTQNAEKFVDELTKEIQSVESRIDYLFITGDIVERGVWKDSKIILDVILRIEQELDIKATFCINGNHDLENGKVGEAFKDFRSHLRISKPLFENEWFRSTEIAKNHWVIEMDCFVNGEDKNSGTGFKALSNDQFDKYKFFLKQNCSEGEHTFFILTHLPVKIDPDSKLNNDKTFKTRNLWPDGEALIQEMARFTNISMVSWFSGDGHVVDAYKDPDDQNFYFLTGRFNGPFEKWGRDRDKQDPKEAHCQFIRTDSLKRDVIRAIKFSTTQEHYGQYSVKWYSKSLDFISKAKFVNRYFETREQENLRRKIVNTIESEGLYSLSKALTKNKNVSLGWVDIHGLLNFGNVFQEFLETSHDLILREYNSGFDNCVFIGLGYWGGAISSFLGCSLNIPVKSIKVRSASKEELVGLEEFTKDKTVFVATDVVSSGETLSFVRKVARINEIGCLVCVMMNPFIQRKLRGVNKIIYGSNEISFPVLEQQNLPESIVPSSFKF